MIDNRMRGLTDRFRDRGTVDKSGFIFFALLGGLGIVVAKLVGLPAELVAIGAALIMVVYAVLIFRSGSGRLRSDQAGDNCYYLGLVYTLASLAFAIFTFDPADTATTIVQGFGIALLTTIIGLILRVFFSQGRPDLEDTEETARLALSDAVSQLRTEVTQVTRTMNELSREVRQSINETREAAAKDIEEFTRNSVSGLREVVDTANEAIRGGANDFAKRSKRYGESFDRLLGALDGHSENIDKLSNAHSALSETADAIAEVSAQAKSTVDSLAAQSESVSATSEALKSGSQQSLVTIENLGSLVQKIDASLTRFSRETEEQLRGLKTAPAALVQEASEKMSAAVASLEASAQSITKLHGELATNVRTQSEASVAASREHNDALRSSLEESRALVGKVRDELADMTEELVRQVEARN